MKVISISRARIAAMAWLLAAAAVLFAHAARGQDAEDRLFVKGNEAQANGDYELAISCWDQVIKMDPKNAMAWFNRGNAHAAFEGKDEQATKAAKTAALADYAEAIRLDPRDADTYQQRAAIYAEQEDYAKAVADYTEILRLKPKDYATYSLRADAWNTLGEYKKSADDYTAMIQLDPKNSDGYSGRGWVNYERGEYAKALPDFTSAIRVAQQPVPDAVVAMRLRGLTYAALGGKANTDKALADFAAVLKITPGDPDTLNARAGVYSDLGQYDKAIADLNESMTASESSPEGYNGAAWLYATCPKAEVRNGPKAVELAIKACELSEWKDDAVIDTLAASEAEVGRWDDALKHEKQAAEMGKASRKDAKTLKEYAHRITLFTQKKPYREEAKKETK